MFHRTIALYLARAGTVLHNRCNTAPCSQAYVVFFALLTHGHIYIQVQFSIEEY